MKKIFTLMMLVSLTLFAADQEKKQDDIDHVAVAALLLRDGHIARANDELNQVNLEDEKLDKIRFYTLRGLVASKMGDYARSNEYFNQSITEGQQDKVVYLYIAQNSYKLKDFEGTLKALEHAGNLIDDKPSMFGLKAECFWQLKRADDALATLRDANERFPAEYQFYRQRFGYLVQLELYQSALEDANVYLANAKPDEKTSLAFIAALREGGAVDKATILAEQVNLRFPASAEVTVLLAHLYIDQNMILAAAELFDQASIEDGVYTKEAAEMMRRNKKFVRSLFKNAQLLDQEEKLKQRIAIYLEYAQYERIVASRSALERSGLIEDENIRYALAYSYYMSSDFERCEEQLKMLTRPDLFQKATELRKNMEKCRTDIWECAL